MSSLPDGQTGEPTGTAHRLPRRAFLAATGLLLADAALFRTGAYFQVIRNPYDLALLYKIDAYKRLPGRPDLVFFGSSRAHFGFDALAIERDWGASTGQQRTAFNFGLNGSGTREAYFILSYLIRVFGAPKSICLALNISPTLSDSSLLVSNAGVADMLASWPDKIDGAVCSDSPPDECADFMAGQVVKSYLYRQDILHRLTRFASAFASRAAKWNFAALDADELLAVYKNPPNRYGDERGFSANDKTATTEQIQQTKEAVVPSSERYRPGGQVVYTNTFFERIMSLAHEHHMDVYTTVTPVFENYFFEYPHYVAEYVGFHRLLQYYREQWAFRHFETYQLAGQIELFSDFQHLNAKGATWFSRLVVAHLLNGRQPLNGLLLG